MIMINGPEEEDDVKKMLARRGEDGDNDCIDDGDDAHTAPDADRSQDADGGGGHLESGHEHKADDDDAAPAEDDDGCGGGAAAFARRMTTKRRWVLLRMMMVMMLIVRPVPNGNIRHMYV